MPKGRRSILDPTLPPFKETFLNFDDLYLDFVEPASLPTIVQQIEHTLNHYQERDLYVIDIDGMMGAGKSRLAQEACQRVRSPMVKMGTIESVFVLAGEADPTSANERLAQALLMAFWGKIPSANEITYDLATVIEKLRKDFGPEVKLVLHLDERSRNVPGLNLLLHGAVSALVRSELRMHIAFVLSGTSSVEKIQPSLKGSRFQIKSHTVTPLNMDSPELKKNFAKALVLNEGVELCDDLQTLLAACGGYPASIVAALAAIRSELRLNSSEFSRTGLLSTPTVQGVFNKVVANLEGRYGETRWVEAITGLVKDNEKRHLTDNSHALLKHIMLVSLVGAPVKCTDFVLANLPRRGTITYNDLEASGLVTLLPHSEPNAYKVVLPLLALTVMNRFLHVVDLGVLESPFEGGFAAHEKLGVASLAVRIRALIALKGVHASCTLADLRPHRYIKHKTGEELVIKLPASVRVVQLGRLLDPTGLPVTASSANSEALSSEDGIVWVAYTNEEGLDGGAVLSGTLGKKKVIVFFEEQFKALDATTDIANARLQNAIVKKVLGGLEKVRPVWIKAWLAHRAAKEKKSIVVVHDLFTDKEKGPEFDWTQVEFPEPVEGLGKTVAMVLTTREDLPEAFGAALSTRVSLKRPAVVSATASATKKSKT